jgi:hypothetical protein
MADRHYIVWLLPRNPVLKKGLFKPDLAPLCEKYDKNMDVYAELAKRRDGLSKYAQQLADAWTDRCSARNANEAERKKSYEENLAETKKCIEQLKAFTDQGDQADMTKMADVFKQLTAEAKEFIELNGAHRAKEQKVNAQFLADVQKLCDGCAKECTDIKAAIDKLEADQDRLEAQIRQAALSHQKTAVKIDKPELVDDLGNLLDGFD